MGPTELPRTRRSARLRHSPDPTAGQQGTHKGRARPASSDIHPLWAASVSARLSLRFSLHSRGHGIWKHVELFPSSDGKLEEERSPVLQVGPEIVGVLQEADSPHENGLTHSAHSLPLWKSHSQRGAGKASLQDDGCLLHEGQPLAGIVLHNPYTNRIF